MKEGMFYLAIIINYDHELQKDLQEQYEGKEFNIKNQAFTELLHLRYSDYGNVNKFIIRFKSVKHKLDILEFKLPEEVYVIIFIEAMNEKFLI
ncbi:hypothetical protein BP6252_08024 [Coleophoma cylindrospora]|uniref:Uncharacterized protein n=1 Tax=Coleophoma cylindrospora TaxID=1849047 RepID=A0A3D8RC55_9HELO|nr:hypothetical protein BP6252_08024 [Coleophoma cylindrospora]